VDADPQKHTLHRNFVAVVVQIIGKHGGMIMLHIIEPLRLEVGKRNVRYAALTRL
jgi:hypothetical protein